MNNSLPLNRISLEHILFLDIEIVPAVESFDMLNDEMKELFDKKTRYQRKDEAIVIEFYSQAGI